MNKFIIALLNLYFHDSLHFAFDDNHNVSPLLDLGKSMLGAQYL